MIFAGPKKATVPVGGAYFVGWQPGTSQVVQRKDFATLVASTSGNLQNGYGSAGTGSNKEIGLVAGGSLNDGGRTTGSQRYTFATNLAAAGATLSAARASIASLCSATTAFFLNGESSALSTNRDDFAFATVTTVSGTAVSPARGPMYGAGSSTKGWLFGGSVAAGTRSATVNAFTYATKVVSVAGFGLAQAKDYGTAASSSVAAYTFGGRNASNTDLSIVQKVAFATETIATTTSLQFPLRNVYAASNDVLALLAVSTTGNTRGYAFLTDTTTADSALGITVSGNTRAMSSAPAYL